MRKIFATLLLATPAVVFAQAGKFQVKGTIGSLDAPAKVYLRYTQDGNAVMDSASLVQGAFAFKGDVNEPVKATLLVNHMGTGRASDAVAIFLEKGTIRVSSSDSAKNARVTGTRLNKDFQQLQSALHGVTNASNALMAEYRAMTEEQRKDKAVMENLDERFKSNSEQRKAVLKQYIQEHPQTLVSLDALKTYAGAIVDYEDVNPLFEGLSAKVRNSGGGREYAERLAKLKATALGATAPDFTQNDPDGNPISLSSFRGQYVLIDFWASWCGPCRAENPNLVKAYQAYKDKNFTVLGVSLDQPNARDKWLKAIEDDQLTWTHVSDLAFWKNAAAVQYGINAIPQNFLVDPNGVIIARNVRGEELHTKLAELIK